MFRWLHQADVAALILRLVLAAIFLIHGGIKIAEYNFGTDWYQEPTDTMSPVLQGVVAWGELVCGVALALGLLTRLAALGVMVIMIGAIYRVTWRLDFTGLVGENPIGTNPGQIGYEYNYAILAMAASLVVLGAGVISLDYLLWRHKPAPAAPSRAEAGIPVGAR
jgi:putative oxidoreductase